MELTKSQTAARDNFFVTHGSARTITVSGNFVIVYDDTREHAISVTTRGKVGKPIKGMGAFVILLNYSGVWVAHGGAMTLAKAKSERAKLAQWSDSKVLILPNVAP